MTPLPGRSRAAAADYGERAGRLVGFVPRCSIDPAGFTVRLSREHHT
ncbi:hypothetical protein [Streptomyces sp. Qhu_M48]